MRCALPLLAMLAVAPAGTAYAQVDDLTSVRRLSPEEKERILQSSSEAAADRALNTALGGGNLREAPQIHGEVGVSVGTFGTGVFGTAVVPLGENGAMILSFEDFRWNDNQRRFRRR